MWDERYASVESAYGTEPNDFLRQELETLAPPAGRALCLAEGEGRNAIYLARHGWEVTGVDQSKVGLDKMKARASEEGLTVQAVHSDLADYDLGENRWDLIVSIWCHVPPELRRTLHAGVARGLAVGGHLILEAYHPRQLTFKTGGPPTAELMMTLEQLREELTGLEFVVSRETQREIIEGPFHRGTSAVTQLVARRS
jgi:SAM-dependent methyltransferase